MRGPKYPKIKEEPGTCGGCGHFARIYNSVGPSATGVCRAKPNRWALSQCAKACKKYRWKGDTHDN